MGYDDVASSKAPESQEFLRQARPELLKVKKTPDSLDCGDYCCFRELRRGACEAIREDRPQTTFDMDVADLELRSLLRQHEVEPSEALVRDLLWWHLRTTESLSATAREGQ